ncbi:MAG: selenocysteine-specific translation elongation factor [Actinobacteria bacterium]|nr:selenocysteine-specific translation elongation factor [Actinomycetota bacterium]
MVSSMSVIGTAGHVDHGKSTLVERLTGINPDRFEEEKRRGLTIDLGFAWLTLPSGRDVGIIDVPGHERFIQNMLAGAGGVSACLFVVAANEGWMPQSAEHLSAIHLLGVTSCVVALTKADLVGGSELDNALAEITERFAGTNLEGAEVVPCSALTGAGLDDLVGALDRALDAAPEPPSDGRARMWVDRSFSIQGAGSVVTGTLAQGTLKVGDQISMISDRAEMPARVRGLQSHKQEVAEIGPGNRTAVNLAGIDRDDIRRGDALCTRGRWATTTLVNVVANVLDASLSPRPYDLGQKGSHLMYVGSAETSVQIKLLDADTLGPGESAAAQIRLTRSLPLQRGDRFVLRDAGRNVTFGGGVVVDPFPEPVARGNRAVAALVRALETLEDGEASALLLERAREMTISEAMIRTGSAVVPRGGTSLGDRLVSAARLKELTDLLLGKLSDYHADYRLERGMPKVSLATALELGAEACDVLLTLVPEVSKDGPFVRLTSHVVDLSPELEEARDHLVAKLQENEFSPPPTASLPIDRALVRALEDAGEIERIADFHLTRAQVESMKEKVGTLLGTGEGVTIAQIRDLLGTSRRYAVPLCEWMDEIGFTRRSGDLRILGPKA